MSGQELAMQREIIDRLTAERDQAQSALKAMRECWQKHLDGTLTDEDVKHVQHLLEGVKG